MKRNKQTLFKISLTLVLIGITTLSLLPPKSGVELGNHDKLGHFIAYSVLSLNAGFVLGNSKKHLFWLPGLIAYGLFMEFLQGFVPGREPSWLDALANSCGVGIGFIIRLTLLIFLKLKQSR